MQSRFGFGRRRSFTQKQKSIKPMESIVNLIDAMLVFACGLMVSLIMLLSLDTMASTNVQDEQGYQEVGQVYVDDETGKTYVLMNEDASLPGGTETGSAAGQAGAGGNAAGSEDSAAGSAGSAGE